MRTTEQLYDSIEIGKSYDMWTFAGHGDLITIKEDNRNADRMKREAENKGWAWFLYKDDPMAHPLHRRLIIMDLKKFKLVKNRQRPDFCYAYEMKTDERKYSIFTMNGGKTFLASVEEPRLDGRWYSEFSETHNSVEECLEALGRFNCR